MDKMVRQLWPKEARPITVNLADVGGLVAMPKVFSTGSVGWYANGKVLISDTPVQVNICITVIGSKAEQKMSEETAEQELTMASFAPDVPPTLPEEQNGSAHKKKAPKRS